MNHFTNYKPIISFVLLAVLSLACSSNVSVVETAQPVNAETLVAATMAIYTELAPTAANMLVPTVTSIPASPTPQPFGEVYVYTTVQNVNLRTNPGLLFTVSRVLPQNTRLRLLGQAPGSEWLNVTNDEGISGWVNSNVVLVAYDGPPAPVVEPSSVILVTGMITTELGTPVSGIGFAVTQGARRTDAKTDDTGHFYAYLPSNMSGVWTVGYVSIACTSNTMDENCNCKSGYCGSSYPESVFVELPQNEPLAFIWK